MIADGIGHDADRAGDPGPYTASMPRRPWREIRLRSTIDQVIAHHRSLAPPTGGVVSVEQIRDLLQQVDEEHVWLVGQHDRFSEATRREAELAGVLLLEAEEQLKELLRTPGKGTVSAPHAPGSPVSRLAAAMGGLDEVRRRLV